MQDRPTGTGHSAYFKAAELLADQLDTALEELRDRQDSFQISITAAARERVRLLSEHCDQLARLRKEHVGD